MLLRGLGGELLVGAGAVAVEVLALARQPFAELGEPIGVGVAGVLLGGEAVRSARELVPVDCELRLGLLDSLAVRC